jgi:hypothetical protein
VVGVIQQADGVQYQVLDGVGVRRPDAFGPASSRISAMLLGFGSC